MWGINLILDGSLNAVLARVNAKVVKAAKLADVKVRRIIYATLSKGGVILIVRSAECFVCLDQDLGHRIDCHCRRYWGYLHCSRYALANTRRACSLQCNCRSTRLRGYGPRSWEDSRLCCCLHWQEWCHRARWCRMGKEPRGLLSA